MKGKKTGGRKAGTPNKTTRITRELLNDVAMGMYDKIREDIKALSPYERVRLWIKLCEFCTPKPQTVSLDMAVDTKRTIEDKLAELSGEEDE